jgi:quercetin dioxygenase-like cupin family protein
LLTIGNFMKILFLHGLNSTPGGVKPTYLKDHGHTVLNPSLPNDNYFNILKPMSDIKKQPLVLHRDECLPSEWPFGQMQRIVTGGKGGVANVHVAKTQNLPHFFHTGYDEIYYVLSGTGIVTLDGQASLLRPGSVVIIPAGVRHSLEATEGEELEFVIFGTPPISIEDERAKPRRE